MKVYLSARYSRREELCAYAADLAAAGNVCTSRWLAGDNLAMDQIALLADGEARDLAEEIAAKDLSDVCRSDVVVTFSEAAPHEYTRGGRHVEFGAALALGLRCVVVGPVENVFHAHAGVERYADWHGALAALASAADDADYAQPLRLIAGGLA